MSTYSNWLEVKTAFEESDDFRSVSNKSICYEKFFQWASKQHLTPVRKIEKIKTGNIEINQERREILLNGREVKMPRKIFSLLVFLASNPGRVFSREDILKNVWGNDIVVLDRTVDVHIWNLRKIIGMDSIESIKGAGYRFIQREKSA